MRGRQIALTSSWVCVARNAAVSFAAFVSTSGLPRNPKSRNQSMKRCCQVPNGVPLRSFIPLPWPPLPYVHLEIRNTRLEERAEELVGPDGVNGVARSCGGDERGGYVARHFGLRLAREQGRAEVDQGHEVRAQLAPDAPSASALFSRSNVSKKSAARAAARRRPSPINHLLGIDVPLLRPRSHHPHGLLRVIDRVGFRDVAILPPSRLRRMMVAVVVEGHLGRRPRCRRSAFDAAARHHDHGCACCSTDRRRAPPSMDCGC